MTVSLIALVVIAVVAVLPNVSVPGSAHSTRPAPTPARPAPAVSAPAVPRPVAPAPVEPGSVGADALRGLQRRIDEVAATTPLLFEAGQVTLTEQGQTGLARVIGILRSAPSAQVTVTGYVARALPRNPERGRRISLDRAEYITACLEAAGIARQRLIPVGAGPEQPKPDRAQNRRVELTVG